MSNLTLVIGNKNYSSWSLRVWLALRRTGVPFEEVVVPLGETETKNRILQHSPSGRVPVLHHGPYTVWESLAICEYLAETFPAAMLWPADREARAVARAVSAEMHAGFVALRTALPMDFRAPGGPSELTQEVSADVARVVEIWRGCRARFGENGPFLFGRFTAADAMFAPVVVRFLTYGVELEPAERAYAAAVWGLPDMREWTTAARAEPWRNREFEVPE